jgi:integrase
MAKNPQSAPSAMTAFDAWARRERELEEMNQQSIDKYRPLWMAWVTHLLDHHLPWNGAQSTHIKTFLDGPAPGRAPGRRRSINPNRMSSYTRQRYWRLLRGVYACAVKDDVIATSPALELHDSLRPSIQARDRQSQILEPFVFARLCQPAVLQALFPDDQDNAWWQIRDRAILAVLVSTAITANETLELRGCDLRQGSASVPPQGQQRLDDMPEAPYWIDIMQSASSVGRSLPVLANLQPLVMAWARTRHTLYRERAALTTSLRERSAFMNQHERHGPLFISRRPNLLYPVYAPMDPCTLYHTVSKAIKNLRPRDGSAQSDTPYVAKGPAVVRNSVLRQWIDTVGVDETIRRGGLKELRSLRLPQAASSKEFGT